jgi:hypothetical protein
MFPNITKNHLKHLWSLKCYPTVREHSRHYREISPLNNHQGDLEIHNDPCAFYEDLLLFNHNHRCSFTFVSMILPKSEIRSSVSSYLIQSRYRLLLLNAFHDIPSSWPSHMLHSFRCNLTEWAQNIFPSYERTNLALGTYASTYSIGKPKGTFQSPFHGNDG